MINQTQLNKLRHHIDLNKAYIDSLPKVSADDNMKNSMALTMSVLMDYYGVDQVKAYDSLTDGDDDNKIDGFYYSDDEDEISELVIIQSKYKNVDGDTSTHSQDEVILTIRSCEKILNGESFQYENDILKGKLETYRNLQEANGKPKIRIRLFYATNGIIHAGRKDLDEIRQAPDNSIYPEFLDATRYGPDPEFKDGHLMVNLKNNRDKTDSVLGTIEGAYYGKITTCLTNELMRFFQETGENLLLNYNVRYKIKTSRINNEMKTSFIDEPEKFCFLNNGITVVCEDFELHATGTAITRIEMTKPSVVNGGQTISTLHNLFKTGNYSDQFEQASLLIRIYKAPSEYLLNIAKATNSQNPINVVDLHSNDEAQKRVKAYFEAKGIGFLTKVGEDIEFYNDTITNEGILQMYAALYLDEPGAAKRSKRTVFNRYYDIVFTNDIGEPMFRRLYLCYQLYRFLTNESNIDSTTMNNAMYSFAYCMKLLNANILNENIPENQIREHFIQALLVSSTILNSIIQRRQTELGLRFSLNNLFKSNEIKDLIDIEIQSN
ncbi:AIPR family protein [Lutimonas halocynthiae]|uniref:AIPR family protein n=1 Tax=Lutimonas halocynthiae TaxID=1446477 RepID=UPI0025B2C7F1|nr:AIPR family protein [Lutimonas halocynthiae]MDN3642918.1 AIPR family protein [Lutimonas halocynthiae]